MADWAEKASFGGKVVRFSSEKKLRMGIWVKPHAAELPFQVHSLS